MPRGVPKDGTKAGRKPKNKEPEQTLDQKIVAAQSVVDASKSAYEKAKADHEALLKQKTDEENEKIRDMMKEYNVSIEELEAVFIAGGKSKAAESEPAAE